MNVCTIAVYILIYGISTGKWNQVVASNGKKQTSGSSFGRSRGGSTGRGTGVSTGADGKPKTGAENASQAAAPPAPGSLTSAGVSKGVAVDGAKGVGEDVGAGVTTGAGVKAEGSGGVSGTTGVTAEKNITRVEGGKIILNIDHKKTVDNVCEYKSENDVDKFKALGNLKFHKLFKGTHELKELTQDYPAYEIEVTYDKAEGKILLTCLYGNAQRVVFNINDPSKAKTPVELNINTDQSTNEFDVATAGTVRTFTPKDTFAFNKVVAAESGGSVTKEFYVAANSGEYAFKVELKGVGQNEQHLAVHLLNNHVKKWKRLGASAAWEYEGVEQGDGSAAKTGTAAPMTGGTAGAGMDKTKLTIVTLKADGTEAENDQSQYDLDDKHGALDYKFKPDAKCTCLNYDGKEIVKFDQDHPISAQFNLVAMSVLFIMRSEDLHFYVFNQTDDTWEHMIDKTPEACVLDANASASTSQFHCTSGEARNFWTKPRFAFNRVKVNTYTFHETECPSEYAWKLVYTGIATDNQVITLYLLNGRTKKFSRAGDGAAWSVPSTSPGSPVASVELDLNSGATAEFSCLEKDGAVTFTTRGGFYAFAKIKDGQTMLFEKQGDGPTAIRVVVVGRGTAEMSAAIHLSSGSVKKVYKTDNSSWAEVPKLDKSKIEFVTQKVASEDQGATPPANEGAQAGSGTRTGGSSGTSGGSTNASKPATEETDEYQLTTSGDLLDYKFKSGVVCVGVKYDGKDVWVHGSGDADGKAKTDGNSAPARPEGPLGTVAVQFHLDLKLASVQLQDGSIALCDFVGTGWALAYQGMPKPVVLDVNSTASTAQFTISSGSSRVFTPRPGFGFKKIIGQNMLFYETEYETEYATKVEYQGYAKESRDIEITLPYGKVMKWNKFDKHKFWKDVTVYEPIKLDIACKTSTTLWEYKEALGVGTYKSKVGWAFYLIYKNDKLVLDLSEAVEGSGQAGSGGGSATQTGSTGTASTGTKTLPTGEDKINEAQKYVARSVQVKYEDNKIELECGLLWSRCYKFTVDDPDPPKEGDQGAKIAPSDGGAQGGSGGESASTDGGSEGSGGGSTETGSGTIELDLMDTKGTNYEYSYDDPDHTYKTKTGFKFSKIKKDGKDLKSFDTGKEIEKVEASFDNNQIMLCLYESRDSTTFSTCFVNDPDSTKKPTPPASSSSQGGGSTATDGSVESAPPTE
ncbi:hypothetical protein MACJ_001602 [Theileria orientalis]|uniref:SfiI-subtelomeric related protein family member n=1 Tax=Theileria orientalis TaxID=68886 RepID=A0A976MAG6_THEOR|nr:hypothetical protein MACJ_001602 [Theileria orientalis]